MIRKPSKTSMFPLAPVLHSEPLTPQPALPVPKRPATKPDVIRKPPAIIPEEVVRNSDKTAHYSNITPTKAVTSLPQTSGPATPTHNTPQHLTKASHKQPQGPSVSPPVLLSPISGNLSTNPFLDLIQTEESCKNLPQSFSGKSQKSQGIISQITPSRPQCGPRPGPQQCSHSIK